MKTTIIILILAALGFIAYKNLNTLKGIFKKSATTPADPKTTTTNQAK